MDPQETPWSWVKAHARILGGIVAAAILLSLVNVALLWQHDEPEWRASMVWPSRTSASTSSIVLAHVYQYDELARANRSVDGAEVTLYWNKAAESSYNDDAAREVHEGDTLVEVGKATSEGGIARLELPPVRSFGEAKESKRFEGGTVFTSVSGAEFIAVVERGKERRVVRQWYDIQDTVVGHLVLDRPLYQPGQKVHARLLVLDRDTGKVVPSPVSWRVEDPQSTLVFERKEGALSAHGTASITVPLADPCVQGAYTITAEANGQQWVRTFDVRPFRLPRFKVSVTSEMPEAVPLEAFSGVAKARTTYDAPVATAQALVEVINAGRVVWSDNGVTDAQGRFPFSLTVPGDVVGPLMIRARVTSGAGRAEQGTTSVPVRGTASVDVEILAGAGGFSSDGITQTGYLVIKGSDGKPLANASVTMSLPEHESTRDSVVTTDADGIAEFTWAPRYEHVISLAITLGSGRVVTRNVSAPQRSGSKIIRDIPSVASAGDSITIRLGPGGQQMLLLSRNAVVLDAKLAPASASAREFTMTLPKTAQGLNTLSVLDEQGSAMEHRSIWVRQAGGDVVAIEVPEAEYRPGQAMSLGLEFPATVEGGAGDPPKDPVTYGVVGVDEALYALKERSDQSLISVMTQTPEVVRSAAMMLEGKEGKQAAVATARFRREVMNMGRDTTRGNELTREYMRHARSSRAVPWTLLLAALFCLAGVLAARAVWQGFSKDAFSWRRLFGMLGVGAAVLPMMFLLAAMGRRGDALAGGGLVWGMVLVGWLLGAWWRLREEQWLTHWGAALLSLVVLGANLVAAAGVAQNAMPDGMDVAVLVLIGAPSVLGGVQLLILPFLLVHRKEMHAGYGLATFFVFVLLMPLALITRTFGTTVQSKFSAADENIIAHKVHFGDGDDFARMEAEEPPMIDLATGKPAPSKNTPGRAAGGPRVRSYFPETMVWIPERTSGPDGELSLELELPDSITTWRVDAWAHTWDGRYGQGQAGIKVVQPFFVEVELPVDLVEGDTIEVPIALNSRSKEPITTALSLAGEGGLSVVRQPAASFTLEPGQRVVTSATVRAAKLGAGALVATAKADVDGGGDAVRRPVRIAPDGRTLFESEAGLIGQGWTPRVSLPAGVIEGSARSTVSVYASPIADANQGLASMLRKPSGCFEQTSSATYPNVMILRALKNTAPEKWPGGAEEWQEAHETATELVALGYQKMLTFLTPDGGFALYPEKKSELMLTTYGLEQLMEMSAVYPVDPELMSRLAGWLMVRQLEKGNWPGYLHAVPGGSWQSRGADVAQLRSTGYVLGVLARYESTFQDEHGSYGPVETEGIERAVTFLLDHIDAASSPEVLARAAMALVEAGKRDAAKPTLERLNGMVTVDGKGAYVGGTTITWMGGEGRYADIETTALTAYTMIRAEHGASFIPKLITYLAGQRTGFAWGSTQTTVQVLRVMELLEREGPDEVRVRVTHNDTPMPRAEGQEPAGDITIERGSPLVHTFTTTDLTDSNTLSLSPDAKTGAMALWSLSLAVPWSSPAADLEGELLVVSSRASSEVAAGSATQITARVENPRPLAVGATIVEVGIAPGAFVPDKDLERMMQSGAIDRYEILPTHVRFYLSGMRGNEVASLSFQMIPLVRGQMSLPPTRAYLYYSPDPMAERDGGDMVVR